MDRVLLLLYSLFLGMWIWAFWQGSITAFIGLCGVIVVLMVVQTVQNFWRVRR